jgi:hypothetical protein
VIVALVLAGWARAVAGAKAADRTPAAKVCSTNFLISNKK